MTQFEPPEKSIEDLNPQKTMEKIEIKIKQREKT